MFDLNLIKKNYKKIIVSSVLILLIDAIFLSMMSGRFNSLIRTIQGSDIKINIISTILCYILMIFSINYFILIPKESILNGFLLGFVIYGIYELTSKAIIRNWRWDIVVIDTLWGATLYGLITFIIQKLNI